MAIATPELRAAERTSTHKVSRSAEILEQNLTIIFRPPREMPPSNHVLKDEPNDTPGDIIDGIRRWDRIHPSKDDAVWHVSLTQLLMN
jgi:hypothetical protein